MGMALVAGRWEGHLLRNGVRTPIAVEFSETGASWSGRYQAGDSTVRLERISVTPTSVHFELPGEGVFDGSVSGGAMAGSVTGTSPGGSFEMQRQEPETLWDPIGSSGP
jgi:hypothetical protein